VTAVTRIVPGRRTTLVALAACGSSSTEPTGLSLGGATLSRGAQVGDDRRQHAQPNDDKGAGKQGGADDPANHR
jgi:hypothetical protein